MKNNNFDLYVWASDINSNTGEGILGSSFLNQYKSFFHNETILIETPNSKFIYSNKIKLSKKNKINNNFFFNYIYPFYGVLLLWFYFFKKKKICFLNFLPLWNFLLIILLPPKTILGPITGRKENLNFYGSKHVIRKFIFPFLYKFSAKFLLWKYKSLLLSTSALKNFFNKNEKKKVIFDFVLTCLPNKKTYSKKKKIDFLFYNRTYDTKNYKFTKFCINNLNNKNIHVVGEFLDNKNVVNHGLISREKTLKLLSKTKFTVLPEDNLYSLFFLDAATANVNIFYSSRLYVNKNHFINLKLNKIKFKESKDLVKNFLQNAHYLEVDNFKISKKFNIYISKGIKNYFNQFLLKLK